jgi:acyl-coenzyme A synthetase/AMP-(fatty) acid ligase
VLTFFGFIHPKYIRGLEYYGVNIVFASGFMIDKWMERPDLDDVDLSAVKIFACGGSYVSPEKYRKYKNFLREHNCESDVLRGYGMSESGAAELSVPENCEEDIIGYPKP